VAQMPFEHASTAGVYNQFCTLLPLLNDGGTVAEARDFPDNGDVWWMVRPEVRGYAKPGQLLTAVLEESRGVGQKGTSHYQARVDSVELLRDRDYIEIIDVPPEAISDARGLVAKRHVATTDHPPMSTVYVRWRGSLFGPMRTIAELAGSDTSQWCISLATCQDNKGVLCVPEEMISSAPASTNHEIHVDVSGDSYPIHETVQLRTCRYHLVEAKAFRDAIRSEASTIVLQTDEKLVLRLAKRFLSRNKRQEFTRLLEDFTEAVSSKGEQLDQEETDTLVRLATAVDEELATIDRLATAILETGLLDSRIETALKDRAQHYISDNVARLQTEINARISDEQNAIEKLEQEHRALDNDLETIRLERSRALDAELRSRRAEMEREFEQREVQIQKQRDELERQGLVLSENLSKVAQQIGENRDELVNQFLAISPLLEKFGLLPGGGGQRGAVALPAPKEEVEQLNFQLPAYISAPSTETDLIDEQTFFERFSQHAERSGFRYRNIDLLSFHVSIKCGGMTVLGGLPGTGKTSMPRIYSEALLGDDYEEKKARFLHIPVSPSWLDMRDLLGHVNSLDRCFQPSESYLYQTLVLAHEEFEHQRNNTGLYIVCLDEMNLAHVEHYFSGFLQVLERTEGRRELRCFAENSVLSSSAFARWSKVNLPPSLRFVGTVNFDETTKQLSQRMLDRVNLINLPSDLLGLDLREPTTVHPAGPPVSLRAFQRWVSQTTQFDSRLGDLIDKLRHDLSVLGCPINPRRFAAMRRYIASLPPALGSPDTAIDLQIAQRVLPQIRGLFRPGARKSLESIRKSLEDHPIDFSESLRVLEHVSESEYPGLLAEEVLE
jgi:hypothetical protein